jgi:hypothetical protein
MKGRPHSVYFIPHPSAFNLPFIFSTVRRRMSAEARRPARVCVNEHDLARHPARQERVGARRAHVPAADHAHTPTVRVDGIDHLF